MFQISEVLTASINRVMNDSPDDGGRKETGEKIQNGLRSSK
jgi:hypothetical protein